jgi:hypothetical protein
LETGKSLLKENELNKVRLKSFLVLILFLLIIKAFGQKQPNQGNINAIKCYAHLINIRSPHYGSVDTITMQDLNAELFKFTLTSSCEENTILSYEIILANNGLTKVFSCNNGSYNPELVGTLCQADYKGGYITIDKVRTHLPDGTIKFILGETLYVLQGK